MKDQTYEQNPGLNYSGAKLLLRSPLHYITKINAPDDEEDSQALKIGTLTHMAALQPQQYDKTVRVAPDVDRRTKDGKAIWEAFTATLEPHQMAIKKDESDMIQSMALAASEALKSRIPDADKGKWHVEEPLYSTYKGKPIKGRPDLVIEFADGLKIIVDIKTTKDASPKAFAKDVSNFKYYLQDAWYKQLTGATRFLFIALEKVEPFDYAIYELDEDAINLGRGQMDLAMDIFSNCMTFQNYPGYPKEILKLTLPKYSFDL
jgi:PDDEXK-like domain of unknown function (DUF3799)